MGSDPQFEEDALEKAVLKNTKSKEDQKSQHIHIGRKHAVSARRSQVRFFFAKNAGSVTEDPVTGSACANLGGYAVASGQALPLGRTLRQGEAVGRPSVPGLAVDAARAIRVSGEVIELGRRHRALVVVLFALMPDPQD